MIGQNRQSPDYIKQLEYENHFRFKDQKMNT